MRTPHAHPPSCGPFRWSKEDGKARCVYCGALFIADDEPAKREPVQEKSAEKKNEV